MDQQSNNKTPNLGTVLQSVGDWISGIGKNLDEQINSPETTEKAEALKRKAEEAVDCVTDELARGTALIGNAIDGAIEAIRKGFEQEFAGSEKDAAEEESKEAAEDAAPCEEEICNCEWNAEQAEIEADSCRGEEDEKPEQAEETSAE